MNNQSYTLLLGGTGFIGRHLSDELIRQGEHPLMYGITNTPETFSQYEWIEGKLDELDKIEEIFKNYSIKRVIHLVSTIWPNSPKEQIEVENKNVILPTFEIIKLMKNYQITEFVFFSSGGTVYGKSYHKESFKEDHVLDPINYYGEVKVLLENDLKNICKSLDINLLIVRPSNPFGTFSHATQGFIPIAINKILKNEEITIFGDGNIIRDYIPIQVMCEYIIKLCLKDKRNYQIYNIGSGFGLSLNQVIESLKTISNEDVKVSYKEHRLVDIDYMVLDINRLINEVGEIKFDINQYIKELYELFEQQLKEDKSH